MGATDTKEIEGLKRRIQELEEKLKGQGNREFKSRLFGFLFGSSEHKDWTLALYNAIHGSSYTNPDDITINTIEDAIYMGMKNDLSILASEAVNIYRSMELYEQQSSYNPNMPVRELMYAGRLYDKFIYMSKLNRYGRKLMPLPIPKLVCFYNGEDPQEEEVTLKLSDAFKEEIRRNVRRRDTSLTNEQVEAEVERLFAEAEPDIEARVRMININYGHNKKMMGACKPLEEYAWLVAKIREANRPTPRGERPGIEAAIDKAIDGMPDDFVIKEYLLANRAEVKNMCLTEYNEAEAMEMFKEEGREDALVSSIRNVMDKLKYTAEQAMELLSIPTDQHALYKGLVNKK